VNPNVGAVVQVIPRLSLGASLRTPVIVAHPGFSDRWSLLLRGGMQVQVNPIFSAFGHYLFAEGRFPFEGPGDREHTAGLGLRLGSRGERFVITNAISVDLRTYRENGKWQFHVRPRDEVRLTGVFRPWLQLSALSEVLIQSSLGLVDMFQLRTGLALHGELTKARAQGAPQRKRPPIGCFWLLGARAGLWPVALVDGTSGTTSAAEQDRAGTVDLVLDVSVTGLF